MTDAQQALAQVREALAAGPTPGGWRISKYRDGQTALIYDADDFGLARVYYPNRDANAALIAACSPANMTAILAHVEAQAAETERLRAELERERMRLAACGVVALANTPESAKKARDMHPDYRSASCDDVARMVDKQMALRAAVEALAALVQRDRVALYQAHAHPVTGAVDEAGQSGLDEYDAALRLADEAMGEGK